MWDGNCHLTCSINVILSNKMITSGMMEWLGCSSSCEYPQGFTIENYNDMKLLCNNIRNSHSFLVLAVVGRFLRATRNLY